MITVGAEWLGMGRPGLPPSLSPRRQARRRLWLIPLMTMLAAMQAVTPLNTIAAAAASSDTSEKPAAAAPKAHSAAPPVTFEPNVGQTDPGVRFLAHFGGGTAFFTPSGVVLSLPQEKADEQTKPANQPVKPRRAPIPGPPAAVAILFLGASTSTDLIHGSELPGRVNYFIGSDRTKWHTGVPTYQSVTYRALYPGVDLTYESSPDGLKGTYRVAPGADPRAIHWRYAGARAVSVDENGVLHMQITAPHAPGSNAPDQAIALTEKRPVSWQDIHAGRSTVPTPFQIAPDSTVSFAVGSFDRGKPLLIDPTVSFSTYLGGDGRDIGNGIAVDGAGSVYVAGATSSSDFPTQGPDGTPSSAYQSAYHSECSEAFVAKLDSTGSALVYSTYIGGHTNADCFGLYFPEDGATGIALDKEGNAYVVGGTSAVDFPTQGSAGPTSNGYQATTTPSVTIGAFDNRPYLTASAFLTKLNPTGSALVYSTYLGSSDMAAAVAVDASGSAYVAGYVTVGNISNFPTTAGAFRPAPTAVAGKRNAFLAKVNAAGSGLDYSTYFGGSGGDQASGLALDKKGHAYITGPTGSTDLPTRGAGGQGAYQASSGTGYVTKLDPARSGDGSLVFSTYLKDLFPVAIAVDADGFSYAAGAGGVTKLNQNGASALYSSSVTSANTIAVDGHGGAVVAGYTEARDFPLVNPIDDSGNRNGRRFISKLAPSGRSLEFSSFFGDADHAYLSPINGIALDVDGKVYVTGTARGTLSTTVGAYQHEAPRGGCQKKPTGAPVGCSGHAFAAKLSLPPPGPESANRPKVLGLQTTSDPYTPIGGQRGGTEVSIDGVYFTGTTQVLFGSMPAPSFRVETPVRITTVSPPHNPDDSAAVEVRIVTRDGMSSADPAQVFTYFADPPIAPLIDSITPPAGTTLGDTLVTVRGHHLFPAQLMVGETDVKPTFNSESRIEAVVPRQALQQTVPVRVRTDAGFTASGPKFTWSSGAWKPAEPLDDPSCGATIQFDPLKCPRRAFHTATLLDPPFCHDGTAPPRYPCGSVLVAGGATAAVGDVHAQQGFKVFDTARIYDPRGNGGVGQWSAAKNMSRPRFFHTATLLSGPNCGGNCGKVLVVGGGYPYYADNPQPSPSLAELFDPVSGEWSPIGTPLEVDRVRHTATQLSDGRVLITGGVISTQTDFGRYDHQNLTPTTDLFDPSTATWRQGPPLAEARMAHTATALASGNVVVVGGLGGYANCTGSTVTFSCQWAVLSSVEEFDVQRGSWSHSSKVGADAVALSTQISIPCQSDPQPLLCLLGLLRPGINLLYAHDLVPTPGCESPNAACPSSLAVPRFGHSATSLQDGRILVVGGGGCAEDVGENKSAELYDPATGLWSATGAPHDFRGTHTSTLLANGKVLASGGVLSQGDLCERDATQSADLFDPTPPAGQLAGWTYADPMWKDRGGHTATLLDGPTCRRNGSIPSYCGAVLVTGGLAGFELDQRESGQSSELYTEAPRVSTLTPSSSGEHDRAKVTIHGTGFNGVKEVAFNGVSVPFHAIAPDAIEVTAPDASQAGPVEVSLINAGGTSRSIPQNPSALFTYTTCGVPAAQGQVSYPANAYSLVGVPGGTRVTSQSLLYGWFNQGVGSYSAANPDATTAESGRGYWAWFACSHPVAIAPGIANSSLPLSAYHASMVGNPSGTSPTTVSGHDFAARWDPTLNGGGGGYAISGYQEPQRLSVGEGMWVFSYRDTTVNLNAPAP